jgi:hypothetical protein
MSGDGARHVLRTTLGAAALLASALAAGAAGQEAADPFVGPPGAADVFSDALTPARSFRVRGLLICLDCDPERADLDGALARCREAGHRHGLRTSGGAVFELRAVDETALGRIYSPDLYGKPVVVDGRLFRSRRALSAGEVGSIVVEALSPRS